MDIVRLTSADPIDIEGLNALLLQQSPGSNRSISDQVLREHVLSNPYFYLYVIREDGMYVGMASMFFQRNLARWIGEIHDVVVLEDRRGRGYGKALTLRLLECAVTFAGQRQVSIKVYLTSRPSRAAANQLYASLGFVKVAASEGAWGTNLYKLIVEQGGVRGLP